MFAARPLPVIRRLAPLVAVSGVAATLLLWAVLGADRPDSAALPELVPVPMADAAPLLVMKYEVSIAEWNRCFDDGACQLRLRAPSGLDPADVPATGLSFVDAGEYIRWIKNRTGDAYRLPTLQEWTGFAAAVMPETPDPIFTDPTLRWAAAYLLEEQGERALRARGSFSTSPDGIADLDGSVWEWTQDCYAGPAGASPDRCPAYFVAGDHVAALSFLVRDPARGGCAVGAPPAHLGLRLVRDAA